MEISKILYSNGANDECYTPEYGVIPILKHIPPHIKTIWCPFDTEQSNFVKLLKQSGYNVIHTHINNSQNFLTYEPEHFDAIISNPPFTNKRGIFERALSFNKPFALIMSNTWLNDAAPKRLFAEKPLQLLMFDKRMEFAQANSDKRNKITYSSSYYCYNFLSQQIIMETLNKPKNGR
jgi:hypothetical protein